MSKNIDVLKLYKEIMSKNNDLLKENYLYLFEYNKDDFFNIVLSFNNDFLKLKYLDKITDSHQRNDIIDSITNQECLKLIYPKYNSTIKYKLVNRIKDEEFKVSCIKDFNKQYQKRIIDRIKNTKLLINCIDDCKREMKEYVLLKINDNDTYKKHLECFSIADRKKILLNLDDNSKLELIFDPIYKKDFDELLNSIKNKNLLDSYYLCCNNLLNKLKIIKGINNNMKKQFYISKLDNSIYKDIYDSNKDENKDEILNNIDCPDIVYDVDKDITFGVELETICNNSEEFQQLTKILNDWIIAYDESVKEGIEIISPKLSFNSNSLKELYCICQFLKKNNFGVDKTCGGHIHLGFNYLQNKKELNTFISFFNNSEDILYYISNRRNDKKNNRVKNYAKSINDIVLKIQHLNRCVDSFKNYIDLIKTFQIDKYYSLNLRNLGNEKKNTLEVRIPNGEINFNELINNIKLYCKLLEKSRYFANNYDYLYEKYMTKELKFDEKKNLFLDLLFDNEEEKNIYKERFEVNVPKSAKTKKICIKNSI